MTPWDPSQYLKFAGQRLRPAVDLLNRVDVEDPREIYDLGAGAGNVTQLLKARWPNARITGIDESAEMLAKAAVAAPTITWERAAALDIWEIEYLQVLEGDDPVKEWVKGTWLKPLLDALDQPDRARFEARYAELAARAYPRRADGRTLFPFRRLFIVARAG